MTEKQIVSFYIRLATSATYLGGRMTDHPGLIFRLGWMIALSKCELTSKVTIFFLIVQGGDEAWEALL